MSFSSPQARGVSAGYPFLASLIRGLGIAMVLVSLVGAVLVMVLYQGSWWWLSQPLLVALLSAVLLQRLGCVVLTLETIYETMRQANAGTFCRRITNTQRLGEVGMVAWEVNDFLDKVESYFKEVDTCFSNAAHGHYARPALVSGQPGMLKKSLLNINRSIDMMSRNAELVAANELHSALHSLNVHNLIRNLRDTQEDLMQIGERMGRVGEEIDAAGISSVTDVWQRVSSEPMPTNILVAINLEYASPGSAVQAGDEVAFFPPVTGG